VSVWSDRAVEIKRALPLEDYLRDTVKLTLRPEGSGYKTLCPFHNDVRPSLFVDAKPREHWTCFGCGKSGDVIKWEQESSKLSFPEALEKLSTVAGLPPMEVTQAQKDAFAERNRHHDVLNKVNDRFLTWAEAEAGKHLKEFKAYLDKRGISLETAKKYRVGYAFASVSTVKQALLDAGCTQAEIDESMLLQNPKLFEKRLIVGVKNNAKWRLIYGRSIDDSEPKHLYQSGTDKVLFNLDRTSPTDKIILVESILDALSLIELGFEHEAVGALGANLTAGQVEDLRRSNKKVWILYDNDKAGRESALKVGLALKNHQHALATLKGKVKDPNDFVLSGGTRTEIEQMLEEAKGNASTSLLIKSLDPTTPKHELPKVVEPVLKHLAQLGEIEAKAFLDNDFKAHFGLKAPDLSPFRQRVERLRKKAEAEAEAERRAARSEAPDLPDEEKLIGELHNGVSYIDGKLWYQFLVPRTEKRINAKTHAEELVKVVDVWYVCSDRTFRKRDTQKLEDEIVINRTPVSVRVGRWSTAQNVANSVSAWRQKQEVVDPVQTWEHVQTLLKTYLWLPDDRYFDVLAAWVFTTYWLPVFDTVGYLFLHASPRSGKTTSLTLLSHLAYEGELMGDVSGSAMFRKIEGSRGAMLLDEMEKLADENYARSPDPAMQVLLTGYKSTGQTQRTDLDLKSDTNSGVVTFSTFAPKIIANTQGIHVQTVRDRAIELILLRSDHKLPQFNERRHEKSGTFQTLRNALYTIALKHVDEIAEWYEEKFESRFDTLIENRGLFGRDYEVWIALWTVGAWLEEKGVKGLLERMIDLAVEHKNSRDKAMSEDSIDAPLLKALRRFVRENKGKAGEIEYKGTREWYTKQQLLSYLKGFPRLNRQREGKLLENLTRLHIIDAQQGPTTKRGGLSMEIVRVQEQKMKDAIKRYDIGDDDLLMLDESLDQFEADVSDSERKDLAERYS